MMRINLKWLTPFLLRLLSLSHGSLANTATAALINPGSVQLVTGFYVGLAATPRPQPALSLDATTYVRVVDHELTIPIMPLHLLGKKSWNVYNSDNIAKVKRDEAVAAAKEAAEDERLQEIDSERRLQILRGEKPLPLALKATEDAPAANEGHHGHVPPRERKKRKRPGEDDTEFELRIAKDQVQPSSSAKIVSLGKGSATANTPLTNYNGHIDLFPQAGPLAANPEAEAEEARKKRELEDQYTLRFSNAGGLKSNIAAKPWYSTSMDATMVNPSLGGRMDGLHAGKDVWGNEDARRKERDAARVVAGDPLRAMKWGAAEVRRVEGERKRWVGEREREMEVLSQDERVRKKGRHRKRRKTRHSAHGDDKGLDDFTLDEAVEGKDARRRHNIMKIERRRRSYHGGGERDRDTHQEKERNRPTEG